MTEITEDLIRKYVKNASEASDYYREPLDPEVVQQIGHLILSWLADSLHAVASMRSLGGAPDTRIASLCRDALPEHTDLEDEDAQVIDTAWYLSQESEDYMIQHMHRRIQVEMRGLLDQSLAYPPIGLTAAKLVDLYSLGILLSVMADVEDARGSCEDPPSEWPRL